MSKWIIIPIQNPLLIPYLTKHVKRVLSNKEFGGAISRGLEGMGSGPGPGRSQKLSS